MSTVDDHAKAATDARLEAVREACEQDTARFRRILEAKRKRRRIDSWLRRLNTESEKDMAALRQMLSGQQGSGVLTFDAGHAAGWRDGMLFGFGMGVLGAAMVMALGMILL